nr:hemerythrin domain-containing protein [Nitrospirota bacterium]
MQPSSIRTFFQQDHARLDDLLVRFQTLKRSDYAEAKDRFIEFKFGLQRHIVWEEDLLFPPWEEATGLIEGGPTQVMRREHRQIADCLEALHKKVQAADPDSDEEEQALLALLSSHNRKEERVLYPALDETLSEEARAGIFRAMNEIPEARYKVCCADH